jgi:hypothetical protein
MFSRSLFLTEWELVHLRNRCVVALDCLERIYRGRFALGPIDGSRCILKRSLDVFLSFYAVLDYSFELKFLFSEIDCTPIVLP